MVKKSPANAGDTRDSGSFPRWGKSHGGDLHPMATHSNVLQKKNPMDRGAWWVMVRGITERVGHD